MHFERPGIQSYRYLLGCEYKFISCETISNAEVMKVNYKAHWSSICKKQIYSSVSCKWIRRTSRQWLLVGYVHETVQVFGSFIKVLKSSAYSVFMHCLLLQENSMKFLILQILFHNVMSIYVILPFNISSKFQYTPNIGTVYATTTSVYYQLFHQWQYLPTNHQSNSRHSFPAIQTTVIHCCVLCLRVLIGRCSQSRMLLHISPAELDDMTTSCPVTLASCLTTTAIHSCMPGTPVAVWSDNRIYQLASDSSCHLDWSTSSGHASIHKQFWQLMLWYHGFVHTQWFSAMNNLSNYWKHFYTECQPRRHIVTVCEMWMAELTYTNLCTLTT